MQQRPSFIISVSKWASPVLSDAETLSKDQGQPRKFLSINMSDYLFVCL